MRALAVALLVVFAAPFAAVANITTSSLAGRVREGDAPAAGVTVTAIARATQQTRTATTSARGTYFINALAPGVYDVSFSRTGLTSLSRPVTIELGRVARADARLEPSEDEESVTATATTISVAGTTAITTHFSGEELDRFPMHRDPANATRLAPGLVNPYGITIDDMPSAVPWLLGEEITDEVTIFRGALPVELGRAGSEWVSARTRSGGNDFFLSIRDTVSSARWMTNAPEALGDDVEHLFESASSGAIVTDRLWFFAAGWGGDSAEQIEGGQHGFTLKLTSQLGASHELMARHLSADNEQLDSGTTGIRYTGVLGERLTAETVVSRASFLGADEDALHAKLSYVAGDHVLSAGGHVTEQRSRFVSGDARAFFVNDRFTFGRFVLNAGVRHDTFDGAAGDGQTTPRLALTYDLHGDGRRAFAASYGQSANPFNAPGIAIRVASIGYATAIGSAGSARIDVLRSSDRFDRRELSVQLDARYRLFDRFELGGTYTHTDVDIPLPEHLANAWIGAQFPLGTHEIGATIVQRYVDYLGETSAPTDLAIRYMLPVSRFALTLAADVTNLFSDDYHLMASPRAARFWVRLRM